MGYKETLMKKEEILNVIGGLNPYAMHRPVAIANAQAEITWDIAEQVGVEKGRKEVVEFISNLIIGGGKDCITLDMNEHQWQAKQKDWGIFMPPEEHSPDPSFHHNKNILKPFRR